MNEQKMRQYISLLESELVPAAGCTEPIAIAYCAAKVREILGGEPERLKVRVSGNILKNVKSVIIPSTGGLKGLRAAVAAGVVAGDPEREFELIKNIPEERADAIRRYIDDTPFDLAEMDTPYPLDIEIRGWLREDTALVRIQDKHNEIVRVERNDVVLRDTPSRSLDLDDAEGEQTIHVRDILEFAAEVPESSIAKLFENQIACNTTIAEEGLRNDWGAGIGKLILASEPPDAEREAKAYAAAGSDARMSGCDLPVVILSGSGNQGLTASLPVIRYAKHIGASSERLHRALAVSALVTLSQKRSIGRLSAYCGAICAGVGAGAGIAYLIDGTYEAVAQTILNAIAVISGTFCDGAKPSCAAKIAAAIDAGILGFKLYLNEKGFHAGEGILQDDVDSTIAAVGNIANKGMRITDHMIIDLMVRG